MTQRGPASRSHRAHVRVIVRSFMALLALSAAAAWAHVPTPPASSRSAKLHHANPQAEPVSAHAARRTPTAARSKAPLRSKPTATHARSNPKARTRTAAATVSVRQRVPNPKSRHEPIALKRAALTRSPGRTPDRALPAPRPAAQPARAKATTAGGELTADDFFRAAGASPDAKTSPEAKTSPDAKAQPAADAPSDPSSRPERSAVERPAVGTAIPSDSDNPASTTAATDARIAALTHPSHQEMAEDAAAPVLLPGLYRNGRLIVPAPLKGTHDILIHQNLMADDEGLERIRDTDALNRLRAAHQLVPLPESASLRLNPELDADRRCARVWTVQFAADTARAFYARFHEPLQVNSAVRTIAFQVRLQRTNGNAAGIGGEAASPHLTGQAIDIGKRGMSIAEIAWMRAYLKPLMDLNKLDVEEEFQQACFHISVYKTYLPAARDVAQVHRPVVGTEISR